MSRSGTVVWAPPTRAGGVRGQWTALRKLLRRQPLGGFSAIVLVVLLLVAVFAEIVAPFGPTQNSVGPSLSGPDGAYLFGTDQFGRDVFSRVVFGARISLYVGLGSTLVAGLGSTALGAAGGYFGGVLDYITQRVVDVAQAVPALMLLIAIMAILGPSMTNVIIALSFRFALAQSRVIRGAVIGIRNAAYVEAAESLGATARRVVLAHILPNVFPTVLVLVSTSAGTFIVAEASLSFLGLGIPPPAPSWGGMMSSDGRVYMLVAPWILIAPTIAMGFVVFAANMLGDALRDEIDPRLRGSR